MISPECIFTHFGGVPVETLLVVEAYVVSQTVSPRFTKSNVAQLDPALLLLHP
jgi:hypothetical protein